MSKGKFGLDSASFQYCIGLRCYKICIYDLYDLKHGVSVLFAIVNEGDESSFKGRLISINQLYGYGR
jgi:hypothetical protein